MQCLFPIHQTFWWFKRHYNQHDSIEPLQSSGRPMKLTDEVLELIDTAMITLQLGNSMSNCSSYIYAICHFALSWKCEKLLGWTFCGSAYCQLIYAQNTEKWLEWAERTCMMVLKTWCMWTDKTTVQPVKVHIWSGISGRGCTEICSFEGIMNAELYTCSVTGTIIQHDCHKSFYVWTNWPTNT